MVYPGFPPIVSLLQKQKHQPCLLCATLIIKSLKTPPRPGETLPAFEEQAGPWRVGPVLLAVAGLVLRAAGPAAARVLLDDALVTSSRFERTDCWSRTARGASALRLLDA